VVPDRIVAGTYLLGAVAARSKITLVDVPWQHLKSMEELLPAMGVSLQISDSITVCDATSNLQAIEYVKTTPYPGFPTDLQSQLVAVMTTLDRPSVVEETVFESRFGTIEQLNKMQACICVDGRKIKIRPVKKLKGTNVQAKDLRGGAALVLAGLMAEGETRITGCEFLERGYVDIVRDFADLGACIDKIEQ